MTITRETTTAILTAARIAEHTCQLPAIATQDWCDLAAHTLLGIHKPSIALILIGHVEPDGRIVSNEATGVAGCEVAEVTTVLGRPAQTSSAINIDIRDPRLAELRGRLAQAHELGWAPGRIGAGVRVAAASLDESLASTWRTGNLGKRWEAVGVGDVLVGVAPLSSDGASRVVIVELGFTSRSAAAAPIDTAVFLAALESLHRRAVMAIGGDTSATTVWLTPREQIILEHLLLGKSVREIASELGRSPHTVHDHVKALHRKLSASSRGELVARALGHAPLGPTPSDDGHPAAIHTNATIRRG